MRGHSRDTVADMKASKVLLIGLDGGSPQLLARLVERGIMPFFATVLESGVSGELRSVFPPCSPSAWSTFITGQRPGRHGVFDFFAYQNTRAPLHLVNSFSPKSEPIWSILSRAGKRVGMVNVPMTYPPQQINGVMITGLLTPGVEHTFTYPPSLYDELKGEIGEYILSVPWRRYSLDKIPQFLEALSYCIEQRKRYALHLMINNPWDFFAVVFSETDMLQHALWADLDPEDRRRVDQKNETEILDFYRRLDEILEEICRAAGDETHVFFISDHGFGPLVKWVHINTWLNHVGVLAFRKNRLRVRRGMRTVRRLIQRLDRYNWLERLPSRGGFKADVLSYINWEQTQAFAALTGEQGIRINLKGREPDGIVAPGREYEQLRDFIISELHNLRDPETGEAAENLVKRREEVHSGPYMHQAPDILFMLGGGKWVTNVFPATQIFEAPQWRFGTGIHRMEGLFAARGPEIKNNEKLIGAGLEDILPTLLYVLGVPIPADIDGKALTGMFRSAHPADHATADPRQNSVRNNQIEALSAEEQQQVIERLRGLGYIE